MTRDRTRLGGARPSLLLLQFVPSVLRWRAAGLRLRWEPAYPGKGVISCDLVRSRAISCNLPAYPGKGAPVDTSPTLLQGELHVFPPSLAELTRDPPR